MWHIVTAVVRRMGSGEILALRRSAQVRTYPGKWHFVSGSIDKEDGGDVRVAALRELREETGLTAVNIRTIGRPLCVNVPPDTVIIVHPVLMDIENDVADALNATDLNWENDMFAWVSPSDIASMDGVPRLVDTYTRAMYEPDKQLLTHIQSIRDDRTHGAAELAIWVLDAFYEWSSSATTDDNLQDLAHQLAISRPAMTPICNTVLDVLDGIDALSETSPISSSEQRAARIRSVTDALRGQSATMQTRLVAAAVETLQDVRNSLASTGAKEFTVITTSLSSTVRDTLLFLAATNSDLPLHVIAAESRPLNEGVRLIRTLSDDSSHCRCTLITDAQVNVFARTANAVIIGADTITAESVVNKVGSYALCHSARDSNVPVFAIASRNKISGQPLPPVLEEKDVCEVTATYSTPLPPSIVVRNIYFESVPRKFFAAVVSEDGLVGDEHVVKEAGRRADQFCRHFWNH